MTATALELVNGRAGELAAVPFLFIDQFANEIVDAVRAGQRVSALFGNPVLTDVIHLYAVLADDRHGRLRVLRTEVQGSFPSLTPRVAQVHLFEREIAEQCGLMPEGHPWLKPVRYTTKLGDVGSSTPLPAVGEFYRVGGEEIHEVAVGPVHAGVIEPGHFRFQCHGERVFHLEIALGFQHRGVEEALAGGPDRRSIHYAETLAGDTTVGHATTYCQLLEALSGTQAPVRAQTLRAIALELERIANHLGDLGALSNDVGFLPTASYCGRIRGDFLNLSAQLCGSRFGRGMVRPGGTGFDVNDLIVHDILAKLVALEKDTTVAVNLLWDSPSVMARFEETGPLPRHVAEELGIVGPAARASGIARDVRHDHPSGLFRYVHVPVSTTEAGDVSARAIVRWLEIQQSIEFVREQLESLPAGEVDGLVQGLAPNSIAVAMNEGWRGEICHVAITNDSGRFARYKVVDPSFHNWSALAYVLREQDISDFPLCNKSFNLSYCGHDL